MTHDVHPESYELEVASRLRFLLQGSPVTHNVSAGVVLSTQSLVMQGVTRGHAGHYVCKAANDQGETTSQPVRLRVKCKYPALSDSPCVTPGPRGSWGRMLS